MVFRLMRFILVALCMAMVGGLNGCTGESDATFVDFSERMPAERPGDTLAKSSNFKVAVGSMISAQETVANYHQLLAGLYLGISRGFMALNTLLPDAGAQIRLMLLPSVFALLAVNLLLKLYMG